MIRVRGVLVLGLLAGLPWGMGIRAAGAAGNSPAVTPTRDVQVVYDVTSPQGSHQSVTLSIRAADQKLRIDTQGSHDYIVIDRKSGTGLLIMDGKQMAMALAPDSVRAMTFEPPKESRFEKTGADTVAGLPCAVYDVTDPHGGSLVCLTKDGVLLSAKERGVGGPSLTAAKVVYGPQDAKLFTIPKSYKLIQQSAP